tara:strand:+ start:79 stop:573 length:495 start_codon:yes stop_codon:yes gene_type:complete
MYNKILNPETNRKVSIFSKKGQEILMNFIEFSHNMNGGGSEKQENTVNNTNESIELTHEDMSNRVFANNNEIWFIKFYAPWCGHCKNMENDWNEASTDSRIKSENIKFGSFDMTNQKNSEFAKKYNLQIKGFPTLKVFNKNGNFHSEYNMERTKDNFINFVNKL